MTTDARERKRAADRKYYASYKGRLNRWRKGEFDARDTKLRVLARDLGYSVVFIGVDTVKLTTVAYSGSVNNALLFLGES